MLFAGILSIAAVLAILLILSISIPQLPDSLDKLVNAPPTIIYDSEGRVIRTIGGRDMITLDRISPHFIDAIIAVEDKNFYRHHGIDKKAVFRSIVVGILKGRRIAGGSTITQQLAKNLFFSFRRDIARKLNEMLVAIQIEASFSKDAILEAYCNQIPFGSRATGVERAARTFFGVPASELSLAKAALLAGLPNSPSRFNPYAYPERARNRQLIILSLMERNGVITSEERALAEAESLVYKPLRFMGTASWFADKVTVECEERFGRDAVYFGGLKIFTTLDPSLQDAAENAVETGIESLDQALNSDSVQVGFVAVSTLSGSVEAMVGGRDYRTSQFNRAVDAHRRPGSGFKPFVYYTAIKELNCNPATMTLDSAITIKVPGSGDWSPRNYDNKYFNRVIFKFALSRSLNSVAARIITETGTEAVAETARNFGVRSPLKAVPSISLGSSEVTPLDMVSAYAVIAAAGNYYDPYFIERVESPRGDVLYEHFVTGKRVADQESLYLLLDMMKEVLANGTGRSARAQGFTHPAAGKTGTTNDFYDSWFIGFTPTLCASVWVGYDMEKAMINRRGRGITGASGALPIWTTFMKSATEGEPPRDFPIPAGIKFASVNIHNGMLADVGEVMTVALPEETELTFASDSLIRDTTDVETVPEVEDEEYDDTN